MADVMELEATDAYDVVYSRFLLEHLPDPLEAVRRMWRAVRPGGLLIADEVSGQFAATLPVLGPEAVAQAGPRRHGRAR